MVVTCVHVFVESDRIEEFKTVTAKNHERSVLEPGNLRFDVLQSRDDPARFLIYEAYESDRAASAHKETVHYLEWRETVAGWMERPREGVPYDVVCPEEREKW